MKMKLKQKETETYWQTLFIFSTEIIFNSGMKKNVITGNNSKAYTSDRDERMNQEF